MNRSRALYHMVRADFLERTRRYSFLLTLGFSVYLGYAVYAGQITLQFDKYRGVANSAWHGLVIGLVASVWLPLIGFYIIKNTIQRDRETRVGQILATTPISKSFYTLAKTLSNFAVLSAMDLILTLAAVIIQLTQGVESQIDWLALVAPVLIFGLSALAVTAAIAVLFESLPILRGGVGNILYFFLWTALIAVGAVAMDRNGPSHALDAFKDYTGLVSAITQMQSQLRVLDPLYNNNASFSVGGLNPATKTFLWTGIQWSRTLLLSRASWFAVSAALSLLASVFFDRFDTGSDGLRLPKPAKSSKIIVTSDPTTSLSEVGPSQAWQFAASLAARTGSSPKNRFFALVLAELRLMLRGHSWWWYLISAGLFIACLASPLEASRSGVILAAWLWPTLIWSQMGTRESQFSTRSIIFSAPRAFPRQLLALWVAGILLAMLTGGGLGLHLLAARDLPGLAAWASGAIFIPSLALALGVCTESRKPFEALYTIWWYAGPMHHLPRLDFIGTTPASSTPVLYLAASALLVIAACSWRKFRLAHA